MHPEKNKLLHLKRLIRGNKNIVMTHKLFERLDLDCLELLKQKGYHLVIDEEPAVFELVADRYTITFKQSKQKQRLTSLELENLFTLKVLGLAKDKTTITWIGPELTRYKDLREDIDNNRVILYNNIDKGTTQKVLLWKQNPEIFSVFKSVHVLTYLFKNSFLNAYLDIHEIPYLVRNLTEEEALDDTKLKPYHKLIHIDPLLLDNHKDIPKDLRSPHIFSSGWFDKFNERYHIKESNPLQTKLNTYYKKGLTFTGKRSEVNDRLWTTLKKSKTRLVTNGITNPDLFVPFNKRATNLYNHTNHLAFIYNVYPNPLLLNYIKSTGIKAPVGDTYALSILVQWIFRSSLREGKHIDLLLPTQRMQNLLKDWKEELSKLYESCRHIKHSYNDPGFTEKEHAITPTSISEFITDIQPGLKHYGDLTKLLARVPLRRKAPVKSKPSKNTITTRRLEKAVGKNTRVMKRK